MNSEIGRFDRPEAVRQNVAHPPAVAFFLPSARRLSSAGRVAASLMPRVRHRSEAVNVDHGQLVYPSLNRFAVVMSLDELAPVGGRATSGRDGGVVLFYAGDAIVAIARLRTYGSTEAGSCRPSPLAQ